MRHPDLNVDRLEFWLDDERREIPDDILSDLYWGLSPKTQNDRYNVQIYYEVVKGSVECLASSSDDKDIEDPNCILNRLAALHGKKWVKISLGTTTAWVINPNKNRQ